MYNINDILAQLQSGKSADEIAKSFTDTLNAAIQKQNEQTKAEERRKAKICDMTNLIEDVIDFISEYYPEVMPKDVDLDITEADVAELIDELDATIPQLASAFKDFEELTVKPGSKVEPIGTTKKRSGAKSVTFEAKDFSFGDAMEKFFKQNGLI